MLRRKIGSVLSILGFLSLGACAANHNGATPGMLPVSPGSSSASPVLLTRDILAKLPRVQLANDQKAHFTAPSLPSNISAVPMQGRRTQSSTGSSDLEVAGTFVQSTGPYTGLSVQNTAYAPSAFPLSFPSGAAAPEELLAPLTSPPGGSCVSATTGAINTGSGPQTYFVVFNNCAGAAPNTIGGVVVAQPIDSAFQTKYVATNTNNSLPEYSLEIGTPDVRPTSASTWYVLLYNHLTSNWDIVYTQRGLSATTYGYSVYYSVFQAGLCPSGLPTIASDNIQLYNPSGPNLSAANASGSGSTTTKFAPGINYGNANCFTYDASGATSDIFTMVQPNTDWTVSASAGTVTEFNVPGASGAFAGTGNPYDITVGPDAALWFTERGSNTIGRVTTSGAVTEFSVPTANSAPSGITVGPDGAIWFTEEQPNCQNLSLPAPCNQFYNVGRMTTSGAFTAYTLPSVLHEADEITTGPDGALWFTESSSIANSIGQLTTSGAFTERKVPTANSYPTGITTGPDGAMWFTESNPSGASKIGRFSASQGFTEFTLPNGYYGANGITTGPDGALWFTESSNAIGRITTAGTFTEYPIPYPPPKCGCYNPGGITTGPDGALWFTLRNFGGSPTNNSGIGRITTSGVFSFFVVPSSQATPYAITSGPDGALWFTEPHVGKIGQAFPP